MIQISRDMIGGVFFATSLLVGGLALAADKPATDVDEGTRDLQGVPAAASSGGLQPR